MLERDTAVASPEMLRMDTGTSELPGSTPAPSRPQSGEETWWARYHLAIATVATLVLLISGWTLGSLGVIGPDLQLAIYVFMYLAGGTFATHDAVVALRHGHVNVDVLMIVAAIGAASVGGWTEGGILLFLFSLSNTLQFYALNRTRRAVRALLELAPEEAVVLRDSQEVRLGVADLVLGDTVVVKPGERLPADGSVLSGWSSVDQSAITGESMPVGKVIGDSVFAGTINGQGLLRVRVERLAHESALAKVIRVVEEAREQKSRTQRFTDKFEGAYAVGIIVISALAVAIPVLFFGRDFHAMFYRAMTLLVVASPCALVISTPASTLSALANAARRGILFKGASHLENTGEIRVVVFDKTGTLTSGRPRVTDISTDEGVSEQELLALAVPIERLSEHPLGLAVVQYAKDLEICVMADEAVHNLQSTPGRGVRADVDGQTIRIGNEAFFTGYGIELPDEMLTRAAELRALGKTIMYVVGARPLGVIAVADTVRPDAPAVIRELHRLGISKTMMLTGDNDRAASAIAQQTGVDEWRAGLMPEQKLSVIREMVDAGLAVAMVGDGVNDAPALATATIGVAMGVAGSDVALETADVVLMADDLTKLPYAIALSRKARQIILQNLSFALLVICSLVVATLLGDVPLPLGVVGHEGSTVIVVSNGLRLLGFKK